VGAVSETKVPAWCARLAACAIIAAAACSRYSGPPDENFAKARYIYEQLYALQLDEAYGDPKMDDVVSLLHKVHKRSVDAPSAQALLHAIEHGREDLAKAHAERDKLHKAAEADVPVPPNIDPTQVLAQPDAGPPQDPYGPGASIAEINKDSGGCLVAAEPFRENGTNKSGTLYRLVGNSACKDRLAGLVGQVVMVSDGKIYRRIPESEVPRPPPSARSADAGVASASDAGTGNAPKSSPASSAPHASAQPSSAEAVAATSDGGI
jgi:hypothetical protein